MCDFWLPEIMWELAAEAASRPFGGSPHKTTKYEGPMLKVA